MLDSNTLTTSMSNCDLPRPKRLILRDGGTPTQIILDSSGQAPFLRFLSAELDAHFVLTPMPAEGWKCLESSPGFNDLNGAKRLNGFNGWNKSPRRYRRARGHNVVREGPSATAPPAEDR